MRREISREMTGIAEQPAITCNKLHIITGSTVHNNFYAVERLPSDQFLFKTTTSIPYQDTVL